MRKRQPFESYSSIIPLSLSREEYIFKNSQKHICDWVWKHIVNRKCKTPIYHIYMIGVYIYYMRETWETSRHSILGITLFPCQHPVWPPFHCPYLLNTDGQMSFTVVIIYRVSKEEVIANHFRIQNFFHSPPTNSCCISFPIC